MIITEKITLNVAKTNKWENFQNCHILKAQIPRKINLKNHMKTLIILQLQNSKDKSEDLKSNWKKKKDYIKKTEFSKAAKKKDKGINNWMEVLKYQGISYSTKLSLKSKGKLYDSIYGILSKAKFITRGKSQSRMSLASRGANKERPFWGDGNILYIHKDCVIQI